MVIKIVGDFPLMFVEVGFNTIDEGLAAKTLLNGFAQVKQRFVYGLAFCDNLNMVPPGNQRERQWEFCTKLVHFFVL